MAVRLTRAGVALTVGIIVLTGLIIGGLFWVKNSGDQARREDAIEIAEQNLEQQSNEEVSLNDGAAEEEQGDGGNETAPESTPETSTAPAPEALPATGAGDSLFALFIIAALAYAGTAYYRSRQTVA